MSRGSSRSLGKNLSDRKTGQRRACFLDNRHPLSGAKTKKGNAMSKRASSKYKIDRRMGENIWGRPKSPVNRREYGPGQHGQRRKGKLSDFVSSCVPSRS